jgi:hypothetical protein
MAHMSYRLIVKRNLGRRIENGGRCFRYFDQGNHVDHIVPSPSRNVYIMPFANGEFFSLQYNIPP